ncbi:MAG: preprotein translocase subunit YajC [Spirochaetes bacterium]|nr:preprotein translocase subunit YajC [Spirochaetota bacterium]
MINLISSLPLMQAGGGMATTVLTFGAVIAVFYLLIIRPQQRKQKETQTMISEIKKFDKVITIGGIKGVVQAVKETSIILKVDDNTKIEFTKNAIATVVEKYESKSDKVDADASSSEEKGN